MVRKILVVTLFFLFGAFLGYKNGYKLGFKEAKIQKESIIPQRYIDTIKILIPDTNKNDKNFLFKLPNVEVSLRANQLKEFTYVFPTTNLTTPTSNLQSLKVEKRGDIFFFVSPKYKNLGLSLTYKNFSLGVEYNVYTKSFSPIIGVKFAF